jgi:hypothetical protein
MNELLSACEELLEQAAETGAAADAEKTREVVHCVYDAAR